MMGLCRKNLDYGMKGFLEDNYKKSHGGILEESSDKKGGSQVNREAQRSINESITLMFQNLMIDS